MRTLDDVGLFVTSGHVIACDPREVIVDDLLSEVHVRVSILYYLNNILVVMTIWKWPLAQTIVDGYSLKQFFGFYNENNIPTINEEGEIVIRKKQYTFQKKKRNVGHFDCSMSRIEKLLSQESIRNMNFTLCCTQNCCQHFLHEKMTLLREKFWGLSFEECKVYGMDIQEGCM